MKNTKIFLAAACSGLLFAACADLDQEPLSNIVTQAQKAQVVADDPEMVSASVNAVPDMVKAYMNTFGTHQDYGWPSMMLMLDSRAQDMPSALGGYQWYTAALEYSDFGGRYYDNLYYWYTNYNLIRSANAVIGVIDPATEDNESQYFRAQALAYRAWAYFNLTQMYAWTYAKNPNDLSVPLVLDTNMDETASNGCPRATVAEVYDQVFADLDETIALLEKAEAAGVNRKSMAASGNLEKTYFNLTAAYAMRARAHLFRATDADYTACVSDCEKALELATAEGLHPYSINDLAAPRFNDITDPSYILGIYYDPSSAAARSIASFASFMSAWISGYADKGFFRCISKTLYASIPDSDVRKGWWLNEDANAPVTLPAPYATKISSANIAWTPYAQIKFGAFNNDPTISSYATDLPLIRVEEVYLMLAEAQGYAQGASVGAQTLVKFLNEFRDGSFKYNAASADELRDEIWMQRRIELWGEGFAMWDILRLQKPVNRVGAGYESTLVFNISPNNTVLLFDIPQSEAQRNPQIVSPSRGSEIPTPVADVN